MKRRQSFLGLAAIGLGLAFAPAGCTEATLGASVRSLQSSGPLSFVCLGSPKEPLADMALPLEECSSLQTGTTSDFGVPHLYALVTQPQRGEVAVIDLTSQSDPVLDQNPFSPGTSFLPVGAMPRGIVSTPSSMATFVAVAEPNFEGIYALPSNMIRGGAPQLTSWPSCALPFAPEEIAVVVDPADAEGRLRPSCDGGYGEPDEGDTCGPDGAVHCHGDLARDAEAAGTPGRYKLVVTLPGEGGFAIVDAQDLLDQEAGAFEPCNVERWVELDVKIPPPERPEVPPLSDACSAPPAPSDVAASGYLPRPAGLALDDRWLYLADRGAPVIHRVDLLDPCDPVEMEPLLAMSSETPSRVVTTSRLALGPLTLDLERFLYAIDVEDGSILVFDVSDDSGSPSPLVRPGARDNPFQPTDRIRFNAPPRDIILLQHQNDEVESQTGASLPVRCDPTPGSSSPGARYQTSAAFDSGAGPTRLRGVFAFAVLASGDIVVIDVDDYDAPCRGPKDQHPLFGCGEPLASGLGASGEYSCRVSAPHQPRSGSYLVHQESIAANQPGVQNLPILFAADGGVVPLDEAVPTSGPRMRATVPTVSEPAPAKLTLADGTQLHDIDAATGLLIVDGEAAPDKHALAFNLADPRAHLINQGFTVTYEGALPGFGGHFASLTDPGDGTLRLVDVGGRFCTRGVDSAAAVTARLVEEEGLSPTEAQGQAEGLADYVQIAGDPPVDGDKYWTEQNECSFTACLETYGTSASPIESRDLRVAEAWEDALSLVPRVAPASGAAPLRCCFPGVVEFRVRGGQQWIVVGDQVGFLHRVEANEDGVCRPSCDPDRALLDGRVRETEPDTVVHDGDPRAFKSPFFRFAINAGAIPSERNMRFTFATQSSFTPLTLTLVANDTDVQPTAIRYLTPTGELAISDGSIKGITFLNLDSLSITRTFQ